MALSGRCTGDPLAAADARAYPGQAKSSGVSVTSKAVAICWHGYAPTGVARSRVRASLGTGSTRHRRTSRPGLSRSGSWVGSPGVPDAAPPSIPVTPAIPAALSGPKARALPDPEQHHGQGNTGEIRRCGGDLAQPGDSGQRHRQSGGEQHGVTEPLRQPPFLYDCRLSGERSARAGSALLRITSVGLLGSRSTSCPSTAPRRTSMLA